MKTHVGNHQTGFTLIEFIVALVVAAIMASMVYTYFGNALTQSNVSIFRLQKASNLRHVMENIVADFNRPNALNLRYNWQPNTYYGLGSVITPKTIPATPDGGHYYTCITAGTSGAVEPAWPITTNGTVTELGGPTWKESGNIVWQKSHPYNSGDIVVPINNTGHYYRATTGGTSGATAPATTAWLPTPVPSTPWTITDGAVTWTEAGTILSSAEGSIENLFALLPAVDVPNTTNTRYGKGYTVTEKRFIRFSDPTSSPPNQETSTGVTEKNILKVTIKNNDSAETLSAIFTIR